MLTETKLHSKGTFGNASFTRKVTVNWSCRLKNGRSVRSQEKSGTTIERIRCCHCPYPWKQFLIKVRVCVAQSCVEKENWRIE